ncbi:rhamnulokinase [Candidatus Laterigemmans baculatus]|uniref:rhamnulokinase n=1 Tax=Candidatus Laterigemmans baculatus TaxID=2770505 RepID=UPI0013D9CAE0|nr:rhamnulokinase family protein [Candidatus Laterigemmans baculatus]
MTDYPVHLAIDLGASGGRVISGGIADDALRMETVARFANEPVLLPNQMCWNMLGLWSEIQHGLRQAADNSRVASVGVATWGVDYVLLDRDDHLVGPAVHYRDPRTRGILPHAYERVPRETLFAETGLQFMEINTAYQLLADVRASAARLQIAESLLMIPDFFHWLLTGVKSAEMTNASTTQLFNPQTRDWSDTVIEGLGIPRGLFCTIQPPGTTLGMVQPSVASRTGLRDVPVVLPATHDTGSAVLAVPANGFAPSHPDWCYISSGTWSLIGCELPAAKITDACAALNFTNECGVGGSTRLLKNIGGLWIFQQIRAALERQGREISWEDMVAKAASATPLSFLLDPDDPEFVAPENMIEAIRGTTRRTGQTFPDDEGSLFRAALEGLALRYRKSIEALESLTGSRIETIHVVGGGSQNPLLCQMTADACGRRVVAGPAEATAIGNLLMQMIGIGTLSSVEDARALVRRSFNPNIYEPQNTAPYDEAAARFERLGS